MAQDRVGELEGRRRVLQGQLDAHKEAVERNRMGQFATPPALAVDILRYAAAALGAHQKLRFLDPALGTGAFYSVLLEVLPKARLAVATGYEIDPHYGVPAAQLWETTGLNLRLEDFTQAAGPKAAERFNLLICNPPYVRHHHILPAEKHRLRADTKETCGVEINGLAGLYCYFLALSQRWLAEGGLAGWLIPSEFMDVNYGASLKRYLLDKVTLLHIHRFDPDNVQFEDALVSSAVVWLRKETPPAKPAVRFTYGGSLTQPHSERFVPVEALRRDPKWTGYPAKADFAETKTRMLGDFFRIKRGLATGNNTYFILSPEEIARRELPLAAFRPILPSPRYVPADEILTDKKGNPLLDRRVFLLDCQWEEAEIRRRYPQLWTYLEEGKAQGIAEQYLCRHRPLWYAQENRPPAPFLCTYLGRRRTKRGRPLALDGLAAVGAWA